jgi:hypothetical protein
LRTIIKATPGFVQFSSKQYIPVSTDPLLTKITPKIKKITEIIKYIYAGAHKLFNVDNVAIKNNI